MPENTGSTFGHRGSTQTNRAFIKEFFWIILDHLCGDDIIVVRIVDAFLHGIVDVPDGTLHLCLYPSHAFALNQVALRLP